MPQSLAINQFFVLKSVLALKLSEARPKRTRSSSERVRLGRSATSIPARSLLLMVDSPYMTVIDRLSHTAKAERFYGLASQNPASSNGMTSRRI